MKTLPYPKIAIKDLEFVDFESARYIDELAVKKYSIPVELFIENAGVHIAHMAALFAKKGDKITVGVGKGNNGGSGLAAARRLLSWGYKVQINIPDKKLKGSILEQLKSALSLGAVITNNSKSTVFIDAFFGISQRLPLPNKIIEIIETENTSDSIKIAVDLPTGFSEKSTNLQFKANIICTPAFPKKILQKYMKTSNIVVIDVGLPKTIFKEIGIKHAIPFDESPMFEIIN